MGSKVVSRYEGSGEFARELAEILALEARLARSERAACRRFIEAERGFVRYCRGVEAVFRASLTAAGYHRHARGAWRMSRTNEIERQGGNATLATEPRDYTKDEAVEIIKRAQAGDQTVLPEIQGLLKSPRRATLLATFGSPGFFIRRQAISAIAGTNLFVSEAMAARVVELEEELTPPDATPIDRLLVDRAVTCWLATYDAENLEVNGRSKDISPQMRELQQRRVDRAHSRFLSAVKALETAQRLKGGSTTVSMSRTERLTVQGGGS